MSTGNVAGLCSVSVLNSALLAIRTPLPTMMINIKSKRGRVFLLGLLRIFTSIKKTGDPEAEIVSCARDAVPERGA